MVKKVIDCICFIYWCITIRINSTNYRSRNKGVRIHNADHIDSSNFRFNRMEQVRKMRVVAKLLILLYILICMVSCSANWHLRKAIQKDPTIIQEDTITVVDTVSLISEKVQVDSVFKLTTDTVIIQKDRLTVKHYYNNDSIYIEGECAEDTLIEYREVKVPYEQIVYKEDKDYIPYWIMAGLFVMTILFFIMSRKQK